MIRNPQWDRSREYVIVRQLYQHEVVGSILRAVLWVSEPFFHHDLLSIRGRGSAEIINVDSLRVVAWGFQRRMAQVGSEHKIVRDQYTCAIVIAGARRANAYHVRHWRLKHLVV